MIIHGRQGWFEQIEEHGQETSKMIGSGAQRYLLLNPAHTYIHPGTYIK
jgi:hypothetical protein